MFNTIVIDKWRPFEEVWLLGYQGEDWEYYETYPEWWALRLWTRRN